MTEQGGRRRSLVKVLTALGIGVTAGVVVGGAVHLLGNGNDATAAGKPVPTPSAVAAPTAGAPLPVGAVVAHPIAGEQASEPQSGRTRTTDGAAAAFTAYAQWLVGSPSAAEDPAAAVAAVGGTVLNPVDARLLVEMQRGPGDGFAASDGAYRVLGHAGPARAPEEVMVEITAPLTAGGKTRWATVGGVVTWTSQGWKLTSIKPSEVAQPTVGRGDVDAFSPRDRSRTLPGLGWRSFRDAKQR